MTINNLEPERLWTYFGEICSIPRLSKNEGQIRVYLEEFARKNGLEYKTDDTGNLLIRKKADPGYENRKCVILQSHLDMVGEKDASTVHDWKNDPIIPVVNKGWVMAENTTLGADDGIGIAAQMSILSDREIKTGEIECLFTVDEESGMTGAMNLSNDWLKGSILLNLDSEDEGELFIGCAGGMDTVCSMDFSREKPLDGSVSLEIRLTGLHGGHSGDEIHKGYGNSVKIMNQLLLELDSKYGIGLHSFNAGNLRNAIPREAFAVITCKQAQVEDINNHIKDFRSNIASEFSGIEPGFNITTEKIDIPAYVIDRHTQENLGMAIKKCPHGVLDWSKDMEGLVETSTNLASVTLSDEDKVWIVTSQRSSVESSKHEVSARIAGIFKAAGGTVQQSDGYPGWKPDTNSEILRITRASYNDLFGREPVVRAIHAGLECGLFLEKYTGLDMISFGPTIKGAHTPQEAIDIESTMKFWRLLIEVLDRTPDRE